jgi:hypothetical protein
MRRKPNEKVSRIENIKGIFFIKELNLTELPGSRAYFEFHE